MDEILNRDHIDLAELKVNDKNCINKKFNINKFRFFFQILMIISNRIVPSMAVPILVLVGPYVGVCSWAPSLQTDLSGTQLIKFNEKITELLFRNLS